MTQFIYAFLSIDADDIRQREAFMDDLRETLARWQREKRTRLPKPDKPFHTMQGLTLAEDARLTRAAGKAHARLAQMAGDMFDEFYGG